jgi:hypothetical protein
LCVTAIRLAGGGSGALIDWQVCRNTVVAPMPTLEKRRQQKQASWRS